MLSSVVEVVLAGLAILRAVQAQTTNVVCLSDYGYLNNTKGQNPCLVSAYLEQACQTDGGNWNVPALGAGQSYTGPWVEDADYCSCSSVVYSLTSACAACQNHVVISWSNWYYNCTDDITTVAAYPLDIPAGTAVPDWAYQNVTASDKFNLSIARSDTAPESVYPGTPTASINYHLTASVVASSASVAATSQATAASDTGSSSKTNVGAIVGGVIGGLVVLALLGVLVFLILRQKRNKEKGSPVTPDFEHRNMLQPEYPATSTSPPHMATSPTMFSEPMSETPKIYDPDDPSTFPKTPASFAITSTTGTHLTPGSHGTSGMYTGAAEVS